MSDVVFLNIIYAFLDMWALDDLERGELFSLQLPCMMLHSWELHLVRVKRVYFYIFIVFICLLSLKRLDRKGKQRMLEYDYRS